MATAISDQQPPIGATFAFDNAKYALEEQLQRIEALDAKAGVLLAADGVLAGLLFATSSVLFQAPRVIGIGVAVSLFLSLLFALLALLARKYEIAPSPPAVVGLMEQGDENWLKWRFLGNLLVALDINRNKLVVKARVLIAAIASLGIVVLMLGAYLIYALATGTVA